MMLTITKKNHLHNIWVAHGASWDDAAAVAQLSTRDAHLRIAEAATADLGRKTNSSRKQLSFTTIPTVDNFTTVFGKAVLHQKHHEPWAMKHPFLGVETGACSQIFPATALECHFFFDFLRSPQFPKCLRDRCPNGRCFHLQGHPQLVPWLITKNHCLLIMILLPFIDHKHVLYCFTIDNWTLWTINQLNLSLHGPLRAPRLPGVLQTAPGVVLVRSCRNLPQR